ncbi:MAG: PD-(D/E)XK nuclease family protein [Bacteroidales bacterium]|nr:PD-(D/E)XK nuclease family protein [Bacteroidales bacterium]
MEDLELSNIIKYGQEVSEIIKSDHSHRPFRLNVIDAACRGRFKETGHSLVLADMLRYPSIQSSFLETFLGLRHDFLEVKPEEKVEEGSMDVTLKGEDIFIIVENKVNAAKEQERQVYRYVHNIEKKGYSLSQIYVVYLNPTNRSRPSNYSLCDEKNEHNVFEKLGDDHFRVLSYKYDITTWLRKIQKQKSINDEPNINSALDQYIDFLENKFQTSPLDKAMNRKINDYLLKELKIEDKTLKEQIEDLVNLRNNTDKLLKAIDNLKADKSNKLIEEWKNTIEQKLGIKLLHDEHSFGVRLNNGVWLGVWDGEYQNSKSKEFPTYWGFQYNSKDMDELYNQEINTLIKTLIEKAGIKDDSKPETDWIAWHTTNNGVDEFISLYKGAEKMGLL